MAAWSEDMQGKDKRRDDGAGEGFRAVRIERIREALARGSYRVDGSVVAGKMVDEAVRSLKMRGFPACDGQPFPYDFVELLSAEFLRYGFPRAGDQTK